MKRTVLVFAILTSIASLAQSQQPAKPGHSQHTAKAAAEPKAAGESDPRIAQIHKVLELTGTRDMVNQMKTVLMDQFRKESPNLPGEMFDEMLTAINPEDLEDAIIPIYLKYFTAEDLRHMIAFYESPFGKKVTRVMPQIVQESNEVGMNWGQSVVTKVATKWRKEGKLTQHQFEQLIGEEERPH